MLFNKKKLQMTFSNSFSCIEIAVYCDSNFTEISQIEFDTVNYLGIETTWLKSS